MHILQGYIDIAGQATRYHSCLRRAGVASSLWLYDRTLPSPVPTRWLNLTNKGHFGGRLRRLWYSLQSATLFTHVHVHKGYSLLHDNLDLRLCRALGVRIIVHYRGSEIRPVMNQACLSQPVVSMLRRQAAIADRILVKDGQLAELVSPIVGPVSVFPNIVDVSDAPPGEKDYNSHGRLRVVHIPSKPEVKGSSIIRESLAPIKDEIVYIEHTRISRSELLAEYRKADLVIDQVLTGTYGNAALEAMALGTPVLNRLDPRFLAYEPVKPPIISIEPSNLAKTVLSLSTNRNSLRAIGEASRQFVSDNHSYATVLRHLLLLYSSLRARARSRA